MEAPSKTGWRDVLTWLAYLPLLALPVANPDLFWHLEAGKRIVAEGALLRTDPMSFTMLGKPWVDFEWLFQLLLLGVHKAAGWPGLLALKALLMSMSAACLWAVLSLYDRGALRRGLFLFAAAISLIRAELKPELFSVILFTVELWWLEADRLGRIPRRPLWVWAGGGAVFFAAWANLHPGFPAGWALLACYCLREDKADALGPAAALAAGAAATLLNPYGPRLHAAILQHAGWAQILGAYILEWKPMLFKNPYNTPQWLLVFSLIGVAGTAAWRKRAPCAPHLLAATLFCLAAVLHSRQGAFLTPVGLAVLASILTERRGEPRPSGWFRACGILWMGAVVVFLSWGSLPLMRRGETMDLSLFPVRAGDFIESNIGMFRRRRLYNEWGWGGYLSYRFRADLRVFMDGRYIFHPLLAETARANADAEGWHRLLDRYGIEWALLANFRHPSPLVVRGRDGVNKKVFTEHFNTYMPSVYWALVYEDPVARVYVRRGFFPEGWVRAREARYRVSYPKAR